MKVDCQFSEPVLLNKLKTNEIDESISMKRNHTAMVGLVLGIVWIILGFVRDNSVLLILGMIVLNVGLWEKFKKNNDSVWVSNLKMRSNIQAAGS